MDRNIDRERGQAIRAYDDALRRGADKREALDRAVREFAEALEAQGVGEQQIEAAEDDLRAVLEARGLTEGVIESRAAAAPVTSRRRPGPEPRPPVKPELLTSPYRFVALNRTVLDGRKVNLDRPLAGGYCGIVEVTWAVETPLLIGDEQGGVVGPMRLGPTGPYVLPGATLRGCLRAALEIVAAGRLSQINGHHRYGLRDFDHPRIRREVDGREESLLDRRKVRAGWLSRREDGGYRITACADWKTVAIADLPGRDGRDEYQWRADWLKTPLADRYALAGATVRNGRIDFRSMRPRQFELLTKKSIGELRPRAGGPVTGTLVFANRSPAPPSASDIRTKEEVKARGQPKKREYVFIDAALPVCFDVPDEAWRRFELINTRPGRNRRSPDGSWRDLEPSLREPGDRIPVFFIGHPKTDPDRFEFGLTRFFKVAHEYSVAAVRDRSPAHCRDPVARAEDWPVDFVEALFGYVFEPEDVLTAQARAGLKGHTAPRDLARRGRIAFGFAVLSPDTPARVTDPCRTIMGTPRASFAPFYLEGTIKDWSDEAATLAGRKRYLPRYPDVRHREAEAAVLANVAGQIERFKADNGGREPSADVQSRLSFLVPQEGATELWFRGTIRLHNVSAAEVGALLWVLTHGMATRDGEIKPYRHMIGRAKPFGAGQVRVADLCLALVGNDAEADSLLTSPAEDELTCAGGPERWTTGGQSLRPFLKAFETHARDRWPKISVAEFLAACDPRHGAALEGAKQMDYPKLKDFGAVRRSAKRSNRYAIPSSSHRRFLPVK